MVVRADQVGASTQAAIPNAAWMADPRLVAISHGSTFTVSLTRTQLFAPSELPDAGSALKDRAP